MNRAHEIDSMTREDFKNKILEIAVTAEFARLFNRGEKGISPEDKEFLRNSFIGSGLKSPIKDGELNEILNAINRRSATYK